MKKKSIFYFSPIIFVLGVFIIYIPEVVSETNRNFLQKKEIKQSNTDAAFNTMMDVISHKRCVNCHPNDNIPKQGEDSHPHYFGMKRGDHDLGFEALNCHTCHQKENNNNSGVPGAPHWGLAPKSMAWEGLSRTEIARAMLDKSKNGNRSHQELIHHLTEDTLVLWAFNPGITMEGIPREKPPVTEEAYKAAVKKWFKNGAIIPEK